jgi:hypothetical protein
MVGELAFAAALLMPDTEGLDQLKSAPVAELVAVYINCASSQTVRDFGLVNTGAGRTVIVNVRESPAQLSALAFTKTVMVAVRSFPPVLVAIKAGMLPLPLAANPILGLLFVHWNTAPGELLVNGIPPLAKIPLQKVVSAMGLITGVGLTVSFTVSVITQPEPVDNVKIYSTTTGCEVVLFSVSLITGELAFAAALLMPATTGLDQLKSALDAELVAV